MTYVPLFSVLYPPLPFSPACRFSVRSFVCLSARLLVCLSACRRISSQSTRCATAQCQPERSEGSPRSPLALQQRNVILSGAKDLLNDNTLCAWSLVWFYRPHRTYRPQSATTPLLITNYPLFTMN